MIGAVLPPSKVPWAVELGGTAVFVAIAFLLAVRWRREGRPGVPALLFIGCFTMFWQEFYADWGAYLYYNPDLHLLPWHHSAYTTPNKPWYVLAGYGWFYAGALPGLLFAFRKVRAARPAWPYLGTLLVLTVPAFWAWNLITADGVSFLTNWYQYTSTVGPAIHTSKGSLPLIYPAFPFVLFAPMVVASLDRRDDRGQTWFERWLRVPVTDNGVWALAHRLGAWAVGMNLMYAAALTVPLVVIRIAFLHDSAIVA